MRVARLGALSLLLLVALPAGATTYELSEEQSVVFGSIETYTARYEDTLTDIARRFSLGYEEIVRANPGVDPWLPGEGRQIVIPGRRILPNVPREGIVINLPEHRLYYFPKRKKNEKPVVHTYPVSIAKMDWHTPLGETRITGKEKNPSWYPPESVRKEHAARGERLPAVVPPGPDNPLGKYKMRLGIPSGAYLIHGTNNPLAVGMAVTHGCMRMYPEDIEELFPLVPVGTKVRIINEPVKVALVDGELLVEAHPPVDKEGQAYEPDLELFSQLLDQALGPTVAAVHWEIAQEALQTANGLPTVVGLEADLDTPDALPGEEPTTAVADAGHVTESQGGSAVAQTSETMDGVGPIDAPATEESVEPAPVPVPVQATRQAEAPVRELPAPLPPSDPTAPRSGSGARTFGAEEMPEATAAPLPAGDSVGIAEAPAKPTEP